MKRQHLIARLKEENGKITFVASDETLDRANEVIPLESWDLNNYLKNPVLLVNHDYKVENIVGLARNLSTSSGKLTFEPEFHDVTDLAISVQELVKKGILNSVSVGFMPHAPQKDGERISNELLEISFVAVGANPNALRLNGLAAKGLSDDKKKEIEEWMKKQNEIVELQRIEFSKDKFASGEDVDGWLKENNYSSGVTTESEDKFIVKYFESAECADGSITENQIEDGVLFVACRRGERAVTPEQTKDIVEKAKQLEAEIETEVKEGRVLSGRNRKQIDEAVGVLKQAIATLEALLVATAPDAGKDGGDKSRKTEVEHETKKASKKVPLSVVRVLQGANRHTNDLLRELK